jgi:hypothetical protein
MLRFLTTPIVSAFLALIFYGSWAAGTNFNFGVGVATKAFLIQGCFAFISTLISGNMALYLLGIYKPLQYQRLWAFLTSMLLLFMIPFLAHTAISTPNKWWAMAPGMVIGNLYVWLLIRAQNK